jgi:hypothetical protein
MRELVAEEVHHVGGGAVFALPLIKVAATTLIAGGIIVAKYLTDREAMKTASELCKDGSDASVKTKDVAVSCKGKAPQTPPKSEPSNVFDPDSLLKARMPYEGTL